MGSRTTTTAVGSLIYVDGGNSNPTTSGSTVIFHWIGTAVANRTDGFIQVGYAINPYGNGLELFAYTDLGGVTINCYNGAQPGWSGKGCALSGNLLQTNFGVRLNDYYWFSISDFPTGLKEVFVNGLTIMRITGTNSRPGGTLTAPYTSTEVASDGAVSLQDEINAGMILRGWYHRLSWNGDLGHPDEYASHLTAHSAIWDTQDNRTWGNQFGACQPYTQGSYFTGQPDSFRAGNYNDSCLPDSFPLQGPRPCGQATLLASPPAQATVGATVTFTTSSGACDTPEYQFLLLPPGSSWTVDQDYSASTTYTWSTTGLSPGSYTVEVQIRNVGSAAPYEAHIQAIYLLTP